MNSNVISGSLVYKGETGLSAYELAVQNGYEGTLEEWLRSLGTSSMFNQYSSSYTTTESTTDFELPEEYIDGGFVNVYVDGLHILSSEYSIEYEDDVYLVRFDSAISSGKSVELVVTLISTQNLPISSIISNTSTDDTASGSKAVYDYIEALFSRIYPVGSIYMSVDSTNPTTLFGGTWVRWGNGKVPVGVDTTQTEFNSVEKTGGEKKHQLSLNEMPNHTHNYNAVNAWGYVTDATRVTPTQGAYGDDAFVYSSTSAAGGSVSHNNLQPYITCYMWKRTA